jgi:hypothetical protein
MPNQIAAGGEPLTMLTEKPINPVPHGLEGGQLPTTVCGGHPASAMPPYRFWNGPALK